MSVLTRMYLNPARRSGQRLLFNRQAMHAAVMAAFSPATHDHMEGRPLWRLDQEGAQRHVLYVVSPKEPDLTHVVEQAGWANERWDSVDYTTFLNRLQRGQRWGFRLTANPVQSVVVGDGRSKVFPHVTVAQQLQWLQKRAAGWGFDLLTPDGALHTEDSEQPVSVTVTQRRDERFNRRGEHRGKGQHVTLRMAQFDGYLQVADADALRSAMTGGMGRAKAYGCGLMTLRPVPKEG